jgi:hypothetical protein
MPEHDHHERFRVTVGTSDHVRGDEFTDADGSVSSRLHGGLA